MNKCKPDNIPAQRGEVDEVPSLAKEVFPTDSCWEESREGGVKMIEIHYSKFSKY